MAPTNTPQAKLLATQFVLNDVDISFWLRLALAWVFMVRLRALGVAMPATSANGQRMLDEQEAVLLLLP